MRKTDIANSVFAGQKKLFYLLILALILASDSAFAKREKYKLDPEHISIGFLAMHLGYAKVLGMFRKAGGEFVFDEDTQEITSVKIIIDTNSVFTNHQKRDDHLRSPDFLDTASFPEMVFTANQAQRTGERTFKVVGLLTLLGQTRPLTLDFTWNKSGRYPIGWRPYVIGVSGRGGFKRSDFGMQYGVSNGLVGDEIELIIEFEAQRQ